MERRSFIPVRKQKNRLWRRSTDVKWVCVCFSSSLHTEYTDLSLEGGGYFPRNSCYESFRKPTHKIKRKHLTYNTPLTDPCEVLSASQAQKQPGAKFSSSLPLPPRSPLRPQGLPHSLLFPLVKGIWIRDGWKGQKARMKAEDDDHVHATCIHTGNRRSILLTGWGKGSVYGSRLLARMVAGKRVDNRMHSSARGYAGLIQQLPVENSCILKLSTHIRCKNSLTSNEPNKS